MYYEQGKLDAAIATYREAISREPNFPEAYNNLGNALREANRMDEAVQCYTISIQLQLRGPATSQAQRQLAATPQVLLPSFQYSLLLCVISVGQKPLCPVRPRHFADSAPAACRFPRRLVVVNIYGSNYLDLKVESNPITYTPHMLSQHRFCGSSGCSFGGPI